MGLFVIIVTPFIVADMKKCKWCTAIISFIYICLAITLMLTCTDRIIEVRDESNKMDSKEETIKFPGG